jgi:hypothetical protein
MLVAGFFLEVAGRLIVGNRSCRSLNFGSGGSRIRAFAFVRSAVTFGSGARSSLYLQAKNIFVAEA